MTQEEKAQAYDEALKRAKILYNDKNEIGYANAESVLEEVFPLLKESEDEKIRKDIIAFIKENYSSAKPWIAWLEKQGGHTDKIVERAKTERQRVLITESNGEANIDWDTRSLQDVKLLLEYGLDYVNKLEKQGKQKIVNNVEPKFKVGDWVVSPNGVYWHIDAIQNGRYEVTAYTGQCGNWPLDTNIYRLWTIQDAKDGDVLTNGDFPCIFKRCDDNGSLYVYCGINAHNDFSILSEDPENVWDDYSKQYFLATKEQRDLLFQKMKEAGYEWDAEKKELKKIEDEEYNGEDYGIDSLFHAQKILEKTLGSVDGYQTDDGILSHQCAITAVKKLYEQKPKRTISAEAKEAMYDKPACVWSEEDEEHYKACLQCFEVINPDMVYYKDYLWLISLKERIGE